METEFWNEANPNYTDWLKRISADDFNSFYMQPPVPHDTVACDAWKEYHSRCDIEELAFGRVCAPAICKAICREFGVTLERMKQHINCK